MLGVGLPYPCGPKPTARKKSPLARSSGLGRGGSLWAWRATLMPMTELSIIFGLVLIWAYLVQYFLNHEMNPLPVLMQ